MFEVLKKLMFAREIKFEEGEIRLLGHRIFLAPIGTIVEIRKELEKINAQSLLYKAAKKSGIDYIHTIKSKFKMKSREFIQWGVNTISLAGWGKTNVIKLDNTNKISIVILKDSTFVKCYGRSSEAIDDVFRGYYAATACVYFKTDMDAVELKCKAMGNLNCEFITKPSKDFDLSNKKIKKQLSFRF